MSKLGHHGLLSKVDELQMWQSFEHGAFGSQLKKILQALCKYCSGLCAGSLQISMP
jgi:hypothetical protein